MQLESNCIAINNLTFHAQQNLSNIQDTLFVEICSDEQLKIVFENAYKNSSIIPGYDALS